MSDFDLAVSIRGQNMPVQRRRAAGTQAAPVDCSLPVLALRTSCRQTCPPSARTSRGSKKWYEAGRWKHHHRPEVALALPRRQPTGSVAIRLVPKADYRLGSCCAHEQRITSHLNLSSDQCRYDHRMRVRGDFRTLAGLFVGLAGIRTDRRVRGLFG